VGRGHRWVETRVNQVEKWIADGLFVPTYAIREYEKSRPEERRQRILARLADLRRSALE